MFGRSNPQGSVVKCFTLYNKNNKQMALYKKWQLLKMHDNNSYLADEPEFL